MLRQHFLVLCLVSSCSAIAIAPTAYAWGERGHNLIARVAARLCLDESGSGSAFGQLLLEKEHLLGHLANVPDIVWKNVDPHTIEVNRPTHYFDIDEVLKEPTLAALPRTLAGLEALSEGQVKALKFGTAPFRIQQLFDLARDRYGAAKAAKTRKDMVDAVNQALLYSGLMAHFIGDLGQPLHTTADHDAYAVGQGGLHGYFEGAVVSAYDLALAQEVYLAAKPRQDLAALRRAIAQLPATPAGASNKEAEPLLLAYALTIDSFHAIPNLEAIDKKAALLKGSSQDHGMRLPATRRPAAEAAAAFKTLAVQRLAMASELLSFLWLSAWRDGGSPDLSDFQSYVYPVAPAVIETPYMKAVQPATP